MSDSSIEYWFRCIDYDVDGYISAPDLLYFLNNKKSQLSFQDQINFGEPINLLYQLVDLVRPSYPDRISSIDIRRSNCGETFFDVLLSLKEKGKAKKYY